MKPEQMAFARKNSGFLARHFSYKADARNVASTWASQRRRHLFQLAADAQSKLTSITARTWKQQYLSPLKKAVVER